MYQAALPSIHKGSSGCIHLWQVVIALATKESGRLILAACLTETVTGVVYDTIYTMLFHIVSSHNNCFVLQQPAVYLSPTNTVKMQ